MDPANWNDVHGHPIAGLVRPLKPVPPEDDVNNVPLQADELRCLADSLDQLASAGATEAVVDIHDAGSVWVAWDDDVLALVVYVAGPVES